MEENDLIIEQTDQYLESFYDNFEIAFDKKDRFGGNVYVKNLEEAISFLSYNIGQKQTWDNFKGVECGMFETKTNICIYVQVSPSLHGNVARINLYIASRGNGRDYISLQDPFVFYKYETKLKVFIDCIENLCSQNGVSHNLQSIKKCIGCGQLLFVDHERILCEYCNRFFIKKEIDEIKKPLGFIYFCSDNEYIKIGSSKDFPTRRITQLSTKYHKSFILKGYLYLEDYIKVEHQLHRLFSEHRVAGEWFNITIDELKSELPKHGYEAKFL